MIDRTPLYLHDGFKLIADNLLESLLKRGGTVRFSDPVPQVISGPGGKTALAGKSGSIFPAAILTNAFQYVPGSRVFIAVKDQVIPSGMAHEVICLPDYQKPDEYFTLSVSIPDDRASMQKNHRYITAWYPSRIIEGENTDLQLKEIKKLIPFLDDFKVAVYTDTLGKNKKTDISGMRFERGLAHNVYAIRDDLRYPEEAVKLAYQVINLL
jgi:hypothetical protein